MSDDSGLLMKEILEDIIVDNSMYVSPAKISELLTSMSSEIPPFKKIHLEEKKVLIDPDGVEELKKVFTILLDTLNEKYAEHMTQDMSTRIIASIINRNLLALNEADIPIPYWAVETLASDKDVSDMYEDEKIKSVCSIYTEVVQHLVSTVEDSIPPKNLQKITKDFFVKNPQVPEISVSESGRVVIEEPHITANAENRELIISKYSSLLMKHIEVLEKELGPDKALEVIKGCYEGLTSRHKGLADLGITKSLFRGVFWPRVPTGIPGLDQLLEGGLPKKSAVILQGPIGSEKTMCGTQFIAEALSGENSVLVVLNNTSVDEFKNFLSRFNIDATIYEKKKRLCYVDCYSWRIKPIKDFEEDWPVIRVARDLSSMGVGIQKAEEWLAPSPVKRAYIELLSPFLKHFEFDPVYDFTQVLNARLKAEDFTSLFILELGMHDTQVVSSIQEVFDGVIDVKVETDGNEIKRSLVVIHMKDTALRPQYYPINVTSEGVRVEYETERTQ
ncbi:MAG: ATPase domain-containing protein [Methanobacteriota archaeon]